MFRVDRTDARGTHHEVARGKDVVRAGDGEVGYDFADEGVEGWVKTEHFFDYVVEEGEVFEVVVLEGFISEDSFLFLVQFLTTRKYSSDKSGERGRYMYSG